MRLRVAIFAQGSFFTSTANASFNEGHHKVDNGSSANNPNKEEHRSYDLHDVHALPASHNCYPAPLRAPYFVLRFKGTVSNSCRRPIAQKNRSTPRGRALGRIRPLIAHPRRQALYIQHDTPRTQYVLNTLCTQRRAAKTHHQHRLLIAPSLTPHRPLHWYQTCGPLQVTCFVNIYPL